LIIAKEDVLDLGLGEDKLLNVEQCKPPQN
jgi:hypothetical protein